MKLNVLIAGLIILIAVPGFFILTKFNPTGKQIAGGEAENGQAETAVEESPLEETSVPETAGDTAAEGAPAETQIPTEEALENTKKASHWTFDSAFDGDTGILTGNIDGNRVKDSASGHDGVLKDGLEPTIPEEAAKKLALDGKVRQALKFDGVDDLVSIQGVDLEGASSLTLSAWINLEDRARSGQTWQTIIRKLSPEFGKPWIYSLNLDEENKRAQFTLSAGEETASVFSESTVLDSGPDKWTLLTATWDGFTMKLYVNGVLENQAEFSKGLGSSNRSVYIGSGEVIGANNFDGQIDDVRIYDYAVSGDDALNIYREAVPAETEEEVPVYEPKGLIGRWDLDKQDSGIADSSGNDNNGRLVGSPSLVEGRQNTALHFDSSGIAVPLPKTAKSPVVSISAWVKLDQDSLGGTLVSLKPQKKLSSDGGVSLSISLSGEPIFSKSVKGGGDSSITGSALSADSWHHLAGVYDGSQLNLYVDGMPTDPSVEDKTRIEWSDDTSKEETTQPEITIAASMVTSAD